MGRCIIDLRVYDSRWNTLAHDCVLIDVEKEQFPMKVGFAAQKLMIEMIRKTKYEEHQKKKININWAKDNQTEKENNIAGSQRCSEDVKQEGKSQS